MLREKSCGIVPFREVDGEILYLVISSAVTKREHWEFPKGGVEEGEREIETALRELQEETGVEEVRVLPGYREPIRYIYRRPEGLVSKQVVYFIARVSNPAVKLREVEAKDYRWANYEETRKLIRHANARALLERCHAFITGAPMPAPKQTQRVQRQRQEPVAADEAEAQRRRGRRRQRGGEPGRNPQQQAAPGGEARPATQQQARGGDAGRPGQQQAAQGGEVRPGQQQAAPGGEVRPAQQQAARDGEAWRPAQQQTARGGEAARPGQQQTARGGEGTRPVQQQAARGGGIGRTPQQQQARGDAGRGVGESTPSRRAGRQQEPRRRERQEKLQAQGDRPKEQPRMATPEAALQKAQAPEAGAAGPGNVLPASERPGQRRRRRRRRGGRRQENRRIAAAEADGAPKEPI